VGERAKLGDEIDGQEGDENSRREEFAVTVYT